MSLQLCCNKMPSKANIKAPCDIVCFKMRYPLFQMSDSCSSKCFLASKIKTSPTQNCTLSKIEKPVFCHHRGMNFKLPTDTEHFGTELLCFGQKQGYKDQREMVGFFIPVHVI